MYTKEQKERALKEFERLGSVQAVVTLLGYPSRHTLYDWYRNKIADIADYHGSLGISCIMMIFFVKMFKNRKNKKYYILNVTHNDRTITVSALFDSGNLLKEPITCKYVSILEWEAAKELFDTEIEFSDIENYIEDMKLWAVPFNSLGNSSDVLFAFLADEINIPEENKTIDKTFIGLYGSRLSNNEEYHALINAGLL